MADRGRNSLEMILGLSDGGVPGKDGLSLQTSHFFSSSFFHDAPLPDVWVSNGGILRFFFEVSSPDLCGVLRPVELARVIAPVAFFVIWLAAAVGVARGRWVEHPRDRRDAERGPRALNSAPFWTHPQSKVHQSARNIEHRSTDHTIRQGDGGVDRIERKKADQNDLEVIVQKTASTPRSPIRNQSIIAVLMWLSPVPLLIFSCAVWTKLDAFLTVWTRSFPSRACGDGMSIPKTKQDFPKYNGVTTKTQVRRKISA